MQEFIDGNALYYPDFFKDPDRIFNELLESIQWKQDTYKMLDKTGHLPRLTAYYGDEGTDYFYTGTQNFPLPWTESLLHIKRAIEKETESSFNSVLLNRYRTGQDSVGWHTDEDKLYGKNPVIASVSFGAVRKFQFKHNSKGSKAISLELANGSLLVMKGSSQSDWKHCVPKTTKEVGERINLTFRRVIK